MKFYILVCKLKVSCTNKLHEKEEDCFIRKVNLKDRTMMENISDILIKEDHNKLPSWKHAKVITDPTNFNILDLMNWINFIPNFLHILELPSD
jgi:hypothetical protein